MKKINWKKVNNFVKNKNFIIAICVFGLTMASIGVSYASFFSVKTNTKNQSISTGTLKVSYGNSSSSIQKTNMDLMSNEEGLAQTDASIVYIENTGSLDSKFVLNVGYDMTNFKSRSNYKDTDKLTPLDYVMIAVYKYNGVGQEDTLIIPPIRVTDLPIYTYDSSDPNNNRYSILFDTLGSTSTNYSTKTYKIKTWLSDKAIPSASYTYFYINSEVVAEAKGAKMEYNLSGTVKVDGTAVENAVVSLQNGSLTSTTSSNGAFNLNGVSDGVYNFDVTYNGITYKGNITMEEGYKVGDGSIEDIGPTFSGTNIYEVAYSYGTTIEKILDKNNITTYSSETTLEGGSLYPTYKLSGNSMESISGITIDINSTTGEFTMSM